MIFNLMLLFVPIALLLKYGFHAPPLMIFGAAILGIVPLAEWVRRGTEHVAERIGSGIGSLLNVSFGNAPELILALFVLMDGHADVVKGQITGSIIGNGLLGLGLAALIGGAKRERQKFHPERASLMASMLILSMIALMVPAFFDYTERGVFPGRDSVALNENLSLGVSAVLILLYIANLVYTLWTHRGIFSPGAGETEGEGEAENAGHDGPGHEPWPLWKSISVLAGATIATALMAELASGALEASASALHVSTFFLGVTVLAVVGNAAEYVSAVYFAKKDQMGMVVNITVGSSVQISLMMAPLLVILSYLLGHPMDLVFANPLELAAIASTAFAVNTIARDGETTWFEGLMLVGVWLVLAIAFYYAAPPAGVVGAG